MDETNQMKSTAVTEVHLMNGDVNKGSDVDSEASNGLEKLDKKMNGASESKASGVTEELAESIPEADKQPAECVSETERNLKHEQTDLCNDDELLKDEHREHVDKNETLKKEPTEKSNENETSKQDQTEHSDENETFKKEQTEHDNKNETLKQEQTENCNKSETLKQERTEHDNKTETLKPEQTEHCNTSETFKEVHQEHCNENESLKQEQTENSNENEPLEQEQTEHDDKTETLKQVQTENCNKSETLKEVHQDHCNINESDNLSSEEVASDLKIDLSIDKPNKDNESVNGDDEQESKACEIERDTQETKACENEHDTQESKACENEHDTQETKAAENEHTSQEMKAAENEQLDCSIADGQGKKDTARKNEEIIDDQSTNVLEGNIKKAVEEGSTEDMVDEVKHDIDTEQALEEKPELVDDSVEKDGQDEDNSLCLVMDASSVSEDTSEPMEDTISALDKEDEISETSLNANKMGTKNEDCSESNVEVSMTESDALIGRSTLDKNESQNISADSTELPNKDDLETEQSSTDEVSAISGNNLNLNNDEEIAAGSVTDNIICKSSAISSLNEVSPDLQKTQKTSDLTQSTQSETVGETPMECDNSINSDTVETKFDNSINSNTVETKVDNSINSKAVKNNDDLLAKEGKTIIKTPTKMSKLKSKTLDQVLSKITSIAENESQQKAVIGITETLVKAMPKKTARKSCASAKPIPIPAKPSITSLTFNVKELEKQGLLDIPKAQKRKAFEPMKIRSESLEETAAAMNSGSSKLKSPVRSPGKTENPFFKKKKLMRRKKGKRGYKLPGEKPARKGKKKKDMEANSSEGLQENIGNCETVLPLRVKQRKSVEPTISHSGTTVSPPISAFYHQSNQGKTQTIEQSSQQKNVLNVLPKTNKPLTVYTPSNANSAKKAKKSVKSVDSMRKIDSFFIGGNKSTPVSTKLPSPNAVTSKKSTGSKDSDNRKRKATGTIPNSSSPIQTPEEKKRKMEGTKSPPLPPQLITLVSTGSSPLGMSKLHPVIHTAGTTPSNPILLAPGGNTGSQTIIQNGTLNGLPMFQILSGPNGSTSQPQQLVAVGAGQGQSLLQNSFPRTTTLLQSNRMPVLLSPVSMQPVSNNLVGSQTQSQLPLSSAVISSATLMTSVASSIHGTRLVSLSNVLSGQQSSSDVVSAIPQTKVYLSNGQIVDSKLIAKNGSLPNGLYPVTPPKTPENNGSLESKDGIELSPGGTPLPDKDVVPLCTCKITGANFQKLALLVTYCQALDSVDGKVMGCCNKVTGTQMVRPAVKVPFLSLCEAHRKRLRVHQCCPGCGHFCTQGKFLQCKKDGSNSLHLFHEQCLVVKDGKNYCPHCGETSAHVEVQLSLEESKPSIMKDMKSSRVQLKARFTAKTASSSEETVEEPSIEFTFEKTKKTISTRNIPFGPDRHSLEKVLACLGQERPKKYRHLPKCLYTPAYDQDLERTLYMLEDGHDPNEKYDDLECQSALHAASTVGSLPVVHVLLQAGGSLHLQDKTLKTPLMCAAENNHLDVVKYLVKAGSIVDSKADDGMTALHYAAKAGYVDVLRILLESEQIIVDVTDDGGWTPLIWAVEHDQIDSVKLLLKRNAEPNLRDSEENTTLHWAAFSGSVVIAELLLTAGCDLDSLNMHGDRPLHIAARQDHYECVVLFLARGADVEAKNNKGETPEECCLDKTTAVYLALKVNRQLKKFGAKHMGRPEKLLHRDLSKGRENIPIPCVNAVDDDGIPQDYLYVTDNIETSSLMVNRVIGSLQSCQCKDDCSSIYCACGKNSVRCWYDKFGRLIPEFNTLEPPLIFECNRACACWTTCNNRVVQNGVMSRLQVFKTDGRGWGCKTLVEIQRGTFICEYIGEHISDSEADRREDDSYLFDLDNRDGETYCIDARKYGNIARFINHLCEPNLVPVKVFVDSQDLRFPRICLFASRDIQAGEELGFDYGEKFWIIKWKHFTCTCAAPKCRYSKDTIQKTLEEYYLRHDDEEAEVVNEEQQTNINTTPTV